MEKARFKAIVIGVSAGAIEALSAILPLLPSDYPCPIFIVVHVPVDRSSAIADLFRKKCQMTVVEAEDKLPIEPGIVYFAPADYHLQIETADSLSLSSEPPVNYSRPAIDVLFETAADIYSEHLLAIVLTGASSDGALGLKYIVEAGGAALVQRPDLAFVSTMPQAALAACPAAMSMTLDQIAAYLRESGAN